MCQKLADKLLVSLAESVSSALKFWPKGVLVCALTIPDSAWMRAGVRPNNSL